MVSGGRIDREGSSERSDAVTRDLPNVRSLCDDGVGRRVSIRRGAGPPRDGRLGDPGEHCTDRADIYAPVDIIVKANATLHIVKSNSFEVQLDDSFEGDGIDGEGRPWWGTQTYMIVAGMALLVLGIIVGLVLVVMKVGSDPDS